MARTSGFDPEGGGSIPPGATILEQLGIQYNRPGYSLTLEKADNPYEGGYCLKIQRKNVPDAVRKGKIDTLTREEFVPADYVCDDQFPNFVYNFLILFEIHEVQEWLKYKGTHFKSPH